MRKKKKKRTFFRPILSIQTHTHREKRRNCPGKRGNTSRCGWYITFSLLYFPSMKARHILLSLLSSFARPVTLTRTSAAVRSQDKFDTHQFRFLHYIEGSFSLSTHPPILLFKKFFILFFLKRVCSLHTKLVLCVCVCV